MPYYSSTLASTAMWYVSLKFAYPHRVWALWWQGGKRRLRTSRCPCRGRLGTLKTPCCPWRGCPAAGQNLETGHLSRHYIAEISLNVTLNHKQTNKQNKSLKFVYIYLPKAVVMIQLTPHVTITALAIAVAALLCLDVFFSFLFFVNLTAPTIMTCPMHMSR